MTIIDNVDWDVDRGVGAEVGICDNGWVESDVGGEVGSGDGDVIQLEVGYKVGSWDEISVDKGVKVSKFGVSVGVDGSVGWSFYKGVGAEGDSSYGTTFVLHDGYDMYSSNGSFDCSNDGKLVGLFLYKSLEYNA